jgi:tetratricopeptide (TPR) repeat protein
MAERNIPGPSSEKPQKTSPEAGPLPSQPSKLRRILGFYVLPLVCLFQLGIIISGFSYGLFTKAPVQQVQEEVQKAELPPPGSPPEGIKPEAPSPEQAAGDIGRADDLLREGRYERALAAYAPLAENSVSPLREGLLYRIGLSEEGLGQWDQALASYRAIISRSAVPQTTSAAQLGQARVWIRMRRPEEAKAVLRDLVLNSANPILRDLPQLQDARYLFALAHTISRGNQDKPSSFHLVVVGFTTSDWSVDRYLTWATPETPAEKGDLDKDHEALLVQKFGKTLDQAQARILQHQVGLSTLLDRLLAEAGYLSEWTNQAQELAIGRTVSLNVINMSVTELLRILSDSLGLVWKLDGKTVRFSADSEVSKEFLATYRSWVTRRILQNAITTYPGHYFAPAAYLELGNLEAQQNNPADAIIWYERLIREMPHSPVMIEANFNLGLMQSRLGDFALARKSFYQVVDGSPAHELTPLAYLEAGRSHLEEGDYLQAINPLRRALAAAAGSSAQGAAAITLAATYLLVDKPSATNEILFENREKVSREPLRGVAAFLDSYARHKLASNRKQAEREAGDVLAALLGAQKTNLLGPVGSLLAGQAYRDLGMTDQMAKVFEKAISEARGPAGSEMMVTLAEYYYTADKKNEAVRLLSTLSQTESAKWQVTAKLRLAEIALKEQKPQECLDQCRVLLTDKKAQDKIPILNLMGKAYEVNGDHQRAARCFAGQTPEG